MDPFQVGIASVIGLLILLGCGVPVAVSLGISGFCGLMLTVGPDFALAIMQTLPYSVVANYTWAVLPLFVLMGTLAASAGLTMDLFRAANMWLSRLRGGLYLAVIAGSAGFAAASGSTVVNAVVFTRLALPEMLKYKYSRSLSLGCICAAGTFAAMIPPSLTMVIYAIITEQSIGKLLLAGVIPGIISAILYAVLILTLVRFKPSLAPAIPDERFSLMDRIRSLKGVWGIALLILLVLGGIYSGLFPPSGAGAVGAFGTFAIALFKLGPKKSWLMEGLRNSAAVACTIFTILIGGLIFSRLLVITGVITEFTQFVTTHIHTAAGIMVAFSLMYIIMGCYLDTASMMIITLPFVFPVIVQYGINPIWFGIIFVKVIEISVITPPVGLNLYAVMSGAGKDANFRDLVFGVIPFIMMDLFTLAILIIFPGLSTWLPETMMGN